MAFMLGVRVASYCLGGAAVIITHEATKTTTQKLSHWLNANKHNLRHPWRWSRSPDPNPQPEPNHAVNEEPDDDDDAVSEESLPCPYHSADSAARISCEPIRVAGPNVPMGAPSVLAAVNEEPDDDDDAVSEKRFPVDSVGRGLTCEPRAKPYAPNVLESADKPDLVPAAGAVGSINVGMKLFRWLPVDRFCNSSKGAPGDTGRTVDPDFWDKIGRITKKILLWAVEYVILERVKNKKVWRQFYNIVKAEFKVTTL
uniref:Uncharacterized protein n=1 Tax=Ananas comosus var. bracteatus TaxID=296719 RepID=A0A6V7PEW1_ANACO|nr:unnamed protein product [Ananas comosus var. bracteatus]